MRTSARGPASVALCGLAVVAVAGCTSSRSTTDPSTYPAATRASTTPSLSAPVRTSPPPTSPTTGSSAVSKPRSSPRVPADVPTTGLNVTSDQERPPVMPIAATQHTAAGAKAFARFFVQTIDWGYATTSSAYMRHYYNDSCRFCRDIRTEVDEARVKRHHYIGDRFNVKGVGVVRVANQKESDRVIAIRADVSASSSVDAAGKIFAAAAPIRNLELRVYLRWINKEWSTVYMVRVLR